MAFQRGDIVEIPFIIPHNNKSENHPAVIISNQDVYDSDNCYICVMLTSSTIIDQFTFEITNDMLLKPQNKVFAQARCHLITYILDKHIIPNSNKNKLKNNVVDRLVEHVLINSLSVQ